MCSAVSYNADSHYFGRNLDIERSYGEGVTVTPRKFPIKFRYCGSMYEHYAMIGMAAVVYGVPLYFDATNEAGLSVAGLNFPDFCEYGEAKHGWVNLASFEVIPFVLGRCATVAEARDILKRVVITSDAFSETLQPTPLHFMISDREESIVLETMRDGVRIYEDKPCVLTNAPGFDMQMKNLEKYASVFDDRLGEGLPGDFSSRSRFVRAAFARGRCCAAEKVGSVSTFFEILSTVAVPKGCVLTDEGELHYTRYSSCCDTERGIYYYKTSESLSVTAVDMHDVALDGREIVTFPLKTEMQTVH